MDGFRHPGKSEIYDETEQTNTQQEGVKVLSQRRMKKNNETLYITDPKENIEKEYISVTELGLSLITMFDNVKKAICAMINYDCSNANVGID